MLFVFLQLWGYYIISDNFWKLTKRSIVLFYYSSRYFNITYPSRYILRHFLYCLGVFLDFSVIFGDLRNNRSFLGSYEKKWKNFHDILRAFMQIKNKLRHFWIVYVCFLIFRLFCGINIIFGHFQEVTKRSNVLLFVHQDILRLLVQVVLCFRLFCIVYICFLIFWQF